MCLGSASGAGKVTVTSLGSSDAQPVLLRQALETPLSAGMAYEKELFLAAFVPGILAAIGYMIAISIYVRLYPESAGQSPRLPYGERFRALIALGRRLSLRHEALASGATGITSDIDFRRLTRDVLLFTLVIELAGAIFAMILAVPIGFLSVRRSGIYFAMVTLAFAQMVYFIAYQWSSLTGGENGLQAVPKSFFGIDLVETDSFYFYYAALPIILLGMWAAWRIVHSPFGRVLVAIRDNAPRARALGYDVEKYKVIAFVLSAGLSGLAGGVCQSLAVRIVGEVGPQVPMLGERWTGEVAGALGGVLDREGGVGRGVGRPRRAGGLGMKQQPVEADLGHRGLRVVGGVEHAVAWDVHVLETEHGDRGQADAAGPRAPRRRRTRARASRSGGAGGCGT